MHKNKNIAAVTSQILTIAGRLHENSCDSFVVLRSQEANGKKIRRKKELYVLFLLITLK